MSGTGFDNPVDGKTYPFYSLAFNFESPDAGVELMIRVVTPDLTAGSDGSSWQSQLESALTSAAEAIQALDGIEAQTAVLQRIDASETVVYNAGA